MDGPFSFWPNPLTPEDIVLIMKLYFDGWKSLIAKHMYESGVKATPVLNARFGGTPKGMARDTHLLGRCLSARVISIGRSAFSMPKTKSFERRAL